MKYAYLLFCLFLACSTNLLAQDRLITNDLEKKEGRIDEVYEKDRFFIRLYPKNGGAPSEYSANDILAYQLGRNSYYETKTIQIENKTITTFLRCYIKGAVSVYEYFSEKGTSYLFLENEQKKFSLLEIRREEIQDEVTKRNYIKETNRFYRDLSEAFMGCPDMLLRLSQYQLNAQDIVQAAVDYHNCVGKKNKLFKITSPKRRPTEYGVYGGINYFKPNVSTKVRAEPGFNVGFTSVNYLAKTRNKVSIQYGLTYNVLYYKTYPRYTETLTDQGFRVPFFVNAHQYINGQNFHFGAGADYGINTAAVQKVSFMVKGGYTYQLGSYRIFTDVRVGFINRPVVGFNLGVMLASKEQY